MLSSFALVFVLLALGAVYWALRMLVKGTWLAGFIRGLAGFSLLALGIVLVFTALEIFSFKKWQIEHPIATLSFEALSPQRFEVTFVAVDQATERTYEIYGDQWQMDARIIRWKGLFRHLTTGLGYRLDRLSGRYFSLEDERNRPRSVHKLEGSDSVVDIWSWVYSNKNYIPLFDAAYGSATYLPMVDGALFQVNLSPSGLVAKPMNDIARDASAIWK